MCDVFKYRRFESNSAFEECLELIRKDGAAIPAHQREWKIGQSFSWHYVKIVEYRTSQMIGEIEDMIMPKGKKNGNRATQFESYSFVRCDLTTEDKKAAKVWIEENTTELGAKIHDAVASDYKFSLSFSSDHDTFTACLVGKEDNAHNPRKTLTARHRDWTVAALTVIYKHEVIFNAGVWEDTTDADDGGWA